MYRSNVAVNKAYVLRCFYGCLGICFVDAILAVLLAVGLYNGYFTDSIVMYVAPIGQFVSSVIGALLSYDIKRGGGVTQSAIAVSCGILMRFSMALLFFEGVAGVQTLLMIVAGCAAVLIVHLLQKRKSVVAVGKRKRRRR